MLGIKPTATVDEVRRAYHAKAMKCHPDHFQDPEQQKAAQTKMVALNMAYELALKQAGANKAPYTQSLDCEDAIRLAQKMLGQNKPESALRQLFRSDTRSSDWFYLQGVILMRMNQFDSAHQSFREAVRREPDNMIFRPGALDAAVAMKESRTIQGRLKHLFKRRG